MVIKKTIDGVEKEIELTREEMVSIACELDEIVMTENVQNYIGGMTIDEINEYEEPISENFAKIMYLNENERHKFYRDCARDILSYMDENDIASTDDLTDVFNEIIIEKVKNIESEEN